MVRCKMTDFNTRSPFLPGLIISTPTSFRQMPDPARHPFACLAACLFAAVPARHAAQDPDGLLLAASVFRQSVPASRGAAVKGGAGLLVEDLPFSLRVERRFNVLGGKKPPLMPEVGIPYPVELKKDDAYPLFVAAGQIEGRTDDMAVATGDVELRKLDAQVFGDKMVYWPLDDEVDATGKVRI